MKSRIIIIFYLLIYTLSGKAQSISFLHLTTDDGLPNNSISSIYQDEREFMCSVLAMESAYITEKKLKSIKRRKIFPTAFYTMIYIILPVTGTDTFLL